MSDLETPDSLEGVAIIGMAGRFPKAKNLDEFWRNLRDGLECTSFFTDQELRASGIDRDTLNDPNYVKARAILEDAEWFDAPFFGIGPREAEIIDPQQRLFLECAWETLENAGYDPETYPGSIGVYAGASMNTYLLNNLISNPELLRLIGDYQTMISNDKDFLPTRVSYKLNLRGPSVNVQTACSTSLVAVRLACQSLLSYQCDMALAGGVSATFPQKKGYPYHEGGIPSPDGRCRAFDSRAQGTFAGQGVGIVALKRLEDAVADGDYVHAVIKGSAINNDGSLKVGYTAPSVDGQAEVIGMALALAEIEARTITYVEAHGTATPLGDPIEIAGLTQAFRASTDAKGFCAIGSVKTNIGHLDAAAGVAGLIKTVLALEHKLLPPSLHFEQPNPKIDFANSPFYVNATLSEWQAGNGPRRAGVSSFGIGGTNAHVVLEEAPPIQSSIESRPWHLLTLSAKTDSALQTATENLVEHLRKNPDLNLADVAYTLQVGRRAFDHRRTLVCSNPNDAVNALQMLDPERVFTYLRESETRGSPVVFMFTGQGAQYVNMALELYQVELAFRKQVDYCAKFLEPYLGLDLRDVLYPSANSGQAPSEIQVEAAAQQLRQTSITQPALFVIEYALAKLWMAWGVHPQAMIGHSIGEYVAACLAGVFSLEEALTLVAARGRLMQQRPSGAMLAVALSEEQVCSLLGNELSLAVINGQSLCVVSGPKAAIDALQGQLAEQEVDCRRLHTSHAFHSEMMTPILEPFKAQMRKMTLAPPRIPFVSNVSGTWITAEEATDPGYWARHLRQTVRFAEGLGELLKQSDRILLEVGPGHTLSSLAKQHPNRSAQQVVLPSLRHPRASHSDVAFLLNTLGRLWLCGVQVRWSELYTHERRHRVPLPTYPFERQRYWVEPQRQTYELKADRKALTKRPDIADWFYIPTWKRQELPQLPSQTILAERKLCWLVFSDECGVGSRLVEQLKQVDQEVANVLAGEQFSEIGEGTYAINPQTREDYDALFKELRTLDKVPDVIVHLWAVTPDKCTSSGLEFLEESQSLGFYSLLFLVQMLGKQGITNPLHIQVVSNNLQAVTEEEVLRPEKATMLGPCRVIPQEYPNITCRSIDIVLPEPGSGQEERLINQFLVELVIESPDTMVAYRGQHRWVQAFEATRLDEVVDRTPELREAGVYLITGGLGGIGLVLAEYLAQAARAKLVLTGRSALPAREEWQQWLETHNGQDGVSGKIRKVKALEGLGAEVMVVSADVTDLEQMREVISRARERFGEIHGVIHAAGVAGGGMIQLKTVAMAAAVLSPKVQGTLVLDAVLDDTELDFFMLCSSINSILAAFGQVDYCGANAFLDAFAHHRHARNGTPFVSINWDTWQEVGMAVNTEVPPHLKKQREENLKHGLLAKEGQEVFSRILGHPSPQVLVSTRDFVLVEQSNGSQALDVLKELEYGSLPGPGRSKQVESSLLHSRPNLQTAYIAPRNKLEEAIADIWQELLGVEQVGIHDDFFDLGGSSLIALRLFAQVEQVLGEKLPLATLVEATTVAQLAAILGGSKDRSVSWSPLVPIQSSGSKPPFFCVHAAGGNVLRYLDLARRLGPDQPFYGLQSQGMDGERPLLTRIEDMAALYVQGIRAVQPEGPYLLGGYCMGGTVALEMAQQLRAKGQEVAMLALFETYNWSNIPKESVIEFIYFVLQKIEFHWRNFALLNPEEKRIFLMEKVEFVRRRIEVWYGMTMSRLGRQTDQSDGQHLRPGQIWDTNDQAALDYEPVVYPGRITHFRPIKEYARHTGSELGWDNLAAEVETHILPVYPAAMLVEPFVARTAEILKGCIAKALE